MKPAFKKASIFVITASISVTDINSHLSNFQTRDLTTLDSGHSGWGNIGSELSIDLNGCIWVNLITQKKVIEQTQVNKELNKWVTELESHGEGVSKRMKADKKAEIITKMLETAPIKTKNTLGYIDLNNSWIVVGATAGAEVDTFLAMLRKSLGGLPIIPIEHVLPLTQILYEFDLDECEYSLGESCKLHMSKGAEIVIKNSDDLLTDCEPHELSAECISLELYNEEKGITFTINNDWSIAKFDIDDINFCELENEYDDGKWLGGMLAQHIVSVIIKGMLSEFS